MPRKLTWLPLRGVSVCCERQEMLTRRRNGHFETQTIIMPLFRLADGTVLRGTRITAAVAAKLEGRKR